jgi:hypothetical protein
MTDQHDFAVIFMSFSSHDFSPSSGFGLDASARKFF